MQYSQEQNNGLCKIWGANRVYYEELENREFGTSFRSLFFFLIFKFLKIFKAKLVSSTLRTVGLKLVYSPTRFVWLT